MIVIYFADRRFKIIHIHKLHLRHTVHDLRSHRIAGKLLISTEKSIKIR